MNGFKWLLRPGGPLAQLYNNLISSKSRCIVRWWRRFVYRRHLYQMILGGKKMQHIDFWCKLACLRWKNAIFCFSAPFKDTHHHNGHEHQNYLHIATQPIGRFTWNIFSSSGGAACIGCKFGHQTSSVDIGLVFSARVTSKKSQNHVWHPNPQIQPQRFTWVWYYYWHCRAVLLTD